jgi:hypothetical protein
MAINPNTQFSSGAVFTADEANRFPRGIMGYATSDKYAKPFDNYNQRFQLT